MKCNCPLLQGDPARLASTRRIIPRAIVEDNIPSVEVLICAWLHLDNAVGVGKICRIDQEEDISHTGSPWDKVRLEYVGSGVMGKK